jgi:predicted ArsR family transcriptional regulator
MSISAGSKIRIANHIVMDVPTQPGDPLSQPTRARLFALLGEQRGPATTEELAAELDRHVNGVRLHLERLAEAGLVTRERQRGGRGRPRDLWRIAAGARPSGVQPTAYAELAGWLVRSLEESGATSASIEQVGREIGRELSRSKEPEGIESGLRDALTALGFQPEQVARDGGKLHLRVCNCPYREAARGHQGLVCGLHRGMTRGMIESLDPAAKVSRFSPKDPDTAGCEIEIDLPVAGQSAGEK